MRAKHKTISAGIAVAASLPLLIAAGNGSHQAHGKALQPSFQTSDRCQACHNGLTTPSGEDVSIGFEWRASIMANSSHDPYWKASVRRESTDHPEVVADIEDECSVCHMPITRYEAKLRGEKGKIFVHFPFEDDKKEGAQAQDGVSCSVCHQISKQNFGTRESFNGGFVIDAPQSKNDHPEYGPFNIVNGNQLIMRTSTGGFLPNEEAHIRQSELCATCHTLYTEARGKSGAVIGQLPEQMPYREWLHSDYKNQKSCQECHMPVVQEKTPIARVLGIPREGLRRHVFVAANFFMLDMLNRYRDETDPLALPQELTAGSKYTVQYLQSQAARISIPRVENAGGQLGFDVFVENLGGHKLPTAYPSRRAWLHVVVKDRDGRTVFESGAVRPDGSIVGNDNDSDPSKYEPHYTEITSPEQVQVYESILGDENGHVTTGLLTGVRYLKDNRILPHGFDKATADKDVAVIGDAANDPGFTGAGDRVRYAVDLRSATGPFQITAELWYQPIGFRWANNLKPYDKFAEDLQFNKWYGEMGPSTGVVIASVNVAR